MMPQIENLNTPSSLLGKLVVIVGGSEFPTLHGLHAKAVSYSHGCDDPHYLLDFGPDFENFKVPHSFPDQTKVFVMHNGYGVLDGTPTNTHFWVAACNIKEVVEGPKSTFIWDGFPTTHKDFWDHIKDAIDLDAEDNFDDHLDDEYGSITICGYEFSAHQILDELQSSTYKYAKKDYIKETMARIVDDLESSFMVTLKNGCTATIEGDYRGPDDTDVD